MSAPAVVSVLREAEDGTPADRESVAHYVLEAGARGPWDPANAHGRAPAALLARAVEHRAAGTDQLEASPTAFLDEGVEGFRLRARTELDRAGTGSTTELHDAAGRFGTATQTLFVDVR
jgi:hypothetical protein